jgi:hypothetical protein
LRNWETKRDSVIFDGKSKESTNQRTVFPEPAIKKMLSGGDKNGVGKGGARFPWTQRSDEEAVDFHSL